jgi:hypothetical protein
MVLRAHRRAVLNEEAQRADARAPWVSAGARLHRVVDWPPPIYVLLLGAGAGVKQQLKDLACVMHTSSVTGSPTAIIVGRVGRGAIREQDLGHLGRVDPRREVQRGHTVSSRLTGLGSVMQEAAGAAGEVERGSCEQRCCASSICGVGISPSLQKPERGVRSRRCIRAGRTW